MEANTMEIWSHGSLKPNYTVHGKDHFSFQADIEAFKNKESFRQFSLEKEIAQKVLKEQIQFELEQIPEESTHYHLLQCRHNFGFIGYSSWKRADEEGFSLLQRFCKVFEQTYTRFLDLQKAEAQAREAQIEAALERVRGKAMAMHSSQDLADTIGVFYKQLEAFNLVPRRCGVSLLNKHNKEGEVYTWNTTEGGESLELVGKIKNEGHPVLENVYKNWVTKTEYHPVLRGNEIKEYYEIIRPQVAFPEYQKDAVQLWLFFYVRARAGCMHGRKQP
ncbi:MAG: hypothetical protein U5K79_01640 [Cyclobacteriaceae bacterium]|nr:hypothetical protein [Cyclobacteriaceae bacterium]